MPWDRVDAMRSRRPPPSCWATSAWAPVEARPHHRKIIHQPKADPPMAASSESPSLPTQ